jgi:hypothetical protein
MCIVDPVAGLTTCAVHTCNANIKTGISSWAAGLSVAGLTSGQVGLGIRAMILAVQIAAIHRMRGLNITIVIITIGMIAIGISIETARERHGQKQKQQGQ